MENFDELLKKYADFIVRVGVNPQPGLTLIIYCPLEGAPLARLCVRSAYEAGARDVQVNWQDDAVTRIRMELGSEEALTDLKPWQLRRYLDYAEREGGGACGNEGLENLKAQILIGVEEVDKGYEGAFVLGFQSCKKALKKLCRHGLFRKFV